MKSVLEKTRAINRLLQTSAGKPVNFKEMAKVLRDNITCNVYIIGRRGQILGHAFQEGFNCPTMDDIVDELDFPLSFNMDMLAVTQSKANIAEHSPACFFKVKGAVCPLSYKMITIVPIIGGGERLGTLVLGKLEGEFTDSDMVLGEYGATVVATEILRSKSEKMEEEARRKAAVQIALGTLSYSEREAVEHIFAELEGNEGLLVASKIADRVGITRSVIVSALRKFESAGVIESKSLGMKGTFIRILNENLLEELSRPN
ncbi:MAG: GTP-sensing pleiotropic transcriptional regulator CodY [Syntrophomonadaceae bacterium]|nr:GTP-sensing pleiotropic transcriptional regulator CodY [Syntrophomonadaceae bacterium]